jgi:hypothetical protein
MTTLGGDRHLKESMLAGFVDDALQQLYSQNKLEGRHGIPLPPPPPPLLQGNNFPGTPLRRTQVEAVLSIDVVH